MNAIAFTVGRNGYRVEIVESCAVSSATLYREAVVEQSNASLPIFTVSQSDHVWEATVREPNGIQEFDALIAHLHRYAEQFDVRYPSALVLLEKAALRFKKREHKRPVRLRPRFGDAFPGASGLPDSAALFDQRPVNKRA